MTGAAKSGKAVTQARVAHRAQQQQQAHGDL